jgi:hypothetical protein
MIMGPKSNDWSPYEEREKFGDMGRRWSCEDGGRDWSHLGTSQGLLEAEVGRTRRIHTLSPHRNYSQVLLPL